MHAEAWSHYRAALRRYSEENGGGWHLLTAAALLRARRCAAALGKQGHYLDLTLRLLAHGLRPALGVGDRRLLWLEALYLLFGLPDIAAAAAVPVTAGAGAGAGAGGLPSVFTARFPPSAGPVGSVGGPITYDHEEGEEGEGSLGGVGGSSMMLDEHDGGGAAASPSPLGMEPMLQLPADGGGVVEAALECGGSGGRQLVSFSVAFPQATAAMGGACPLVLRIVSHLPLPVRPARLLLRFNKDYLGTITVLDAAALSPTDRLKDSLQPNATATAPPPPPPPPSSSSYQDVDDNGTARSPLLLLPDTPLDIRLAVPVPTHELVEVGDLLHALSLHVVIDPPSPPPPSTTTLPCSARPYARPFALRLPSGVACLEGAVRAANVCCYQPPSSSSSSPLVVAQPSSLPVPLHASLRGFPAVEVIRPLASATLGLAGTTMAPSATTAAAWAEAAMMEDGEMARAVPSVPLLVGHMQRLWVRVESHADRLGTPMLYVRSDPPPPTTRAEDALFFRLGGADGRTPVPLQLGKDRQPEKALDVLELAAAGGAGGLGKDKTVPPQSTLLVPVWVRATQEGRVKVRVRGVWCGAVPCMIVD
jgi:hypothetical protein